MSWKLYCHQQSRQRELKRWRQQNCSVINCDFMCYLMQFKTLVELETEFLTFQTTKILFNPQHFWWTRKHFCQPWGIPVGHPVSHLCMVLLNTKATWYSWLLCFSRLLLIITTTSWPDSGTQSTAWKPQGQKWTHYHTVLWRKKERSFRSGHPYPACCSKTLLEVRDIFCHLLVASAVCFRSHSFWSFTSTCPAAPWLSAAGLTEENDRAKLGLRPAY